MQRKTTITRNLEDTILNTYFKLLFKELSRIRSPPVCGISSVMKVIPYSTTHYCQSARLSKTSYLDKLTSINGYTWRHQHELIAFVTFDAQKDKHGG